MNFNFIYEPQKELEADTYIGEIVSVDTVLSKRTKNENLVVEFAPYKKGKAYKHISLWLEPTYHTKNDLVYKFIKALDNLKCEKDFSDFIGCRLVICISSNVKDGIEYFNITDVDVSNELARENKDIYWEKMTQRISEEAGKDRHKNSQIDMETIFSDDEEDDESEKLDTSVDDDISDSVDDSIEDDNLTDKEDSEEEYFFTKDDLDDDDDLDDEEDYEEYDGEYDDEEDSEEDDEY